MEKISGKITPFKIEYWLNKGYSENESNEKVRIHKLKCGRKLENFIYNHGEINGPIKYKEFCEKSKHTLETFITKYGDIDGKNKWCEYLKSKDSNSKTWALKKSNGDINIANEMLSKRKESVVLSLEKLIKKYGDIDIAKNKLIEINKNKDGSSLSYFLKKTNGDRKKAIKLFQESSSKIDSVASIDLSMNISSIFLSRSFSKNSFSLAFLSRKESNSNMKRLSASDTISLLQSKSDFI